MGGARRNETLFLGDPKRLKRAPHTREEAIKSVCRDKTIWGTIAEFNLSRTKKGGDTQCRTELKSSKSGSCGGIYESGLMC